MKILRPVVFRPHLAIGLALFITKKARPPLKATRLFIFRHVAYCLPKQMLIVFCLIPQIVVIECYGKAKEKSTYFFQSFSYNQVPCTDTLKISKKHQKYRYEKISGLLETINYLIFTVLIVLLSDGLHALACRAL